MIYIPHFIGNREAYLATLEYVQNEWNNDSNKIDTFLYLKDKKIESILDIGCNLGVFTDKVIGELEPTKIEIFEPDEFNIKIIKANLGSDFRVGINPYGIFYGAKSGKVKGTGDGNTGGYIFEGVNTDHLRAHIENLVVYENKIFLMQTLEESIDFIPDLIKMDVEGSEYNIIENSSLLKEARFLVIEFHGHNKTFISDYLSQWLPTFKRIIFTEDHLNNDQYSYALLENENI